jgi:hypothetical protein
LVWPIWWHRFLAIEIKPAEHRACRFALILQKSSRGSLPYARENWRVLTPTGLF